MRRTWIIEVCKTCARLAVWPFCEHREEWLNRHGDQPLRWYTSVRVTGHWKEPEAPDLPSVAPLLGRVMDLADQVAAQVTPEETEKAIENITRKVSE